MVANWYTWSIGILSEGTVVANRLWTALRERFASSPASRAARLEAVHAQPAAGDLSLGLRLTSEAQLLDRLVVVRPDTVAVLFEEGEPPRLKFPGDQLRPALVPRLHPIRVLVVNTAPVSLDVTIAQLVTLDRRAIERTTIRLSVQLSDVEDYGWVGYLAAEFGADLESHLLGRVESEVVTGAQAAIAMNRLADVRRLTIQHVLADHWLPTTFAGGALIRCDFSVLGVVWPPEPTASAPAAAGARTDHAGWDPGGNEPPLKLNLDEGLLGLWRDHVGTELRGIAGAQVDAESTVIAAPTSEPGPYESSVLRESLAGYFDDRRVHVVVAVADSYADLVRAWFTQVDGGSGRLVSVEVLDLDMLRITVDQTPESRGEIDRGLLVGTSSDREALRRLVPQQRVAFLAADPVG